jgi:hypothetical protein
VIVVINRLLDIDYEVLFPIYDEFCCVTGSETYVGRWKFNTLKRMPRESTDFKMMPQESMDTAAS